jgi:hypothetical protein
VQLNYLRRFLAEGFQLHLQCNELLHQASSRQASDCMTPLDCNTSPLLELS